MQSIKTLWGMGVVISKFLQVLHRIPLSGKWLALICFYSRSCAHIWQRSLHCQVQSIHSHLKGAVHLPPPNPTVWNKLHKRNNESDYVKRPVKDTVETRRERRGKYHPAVVTRGDIHNNSKPSAVRQGVIFRFINSECCCPRRRGTWHQHLKDRLSWASCFLSILPLLSLMRVRRRAILTNAD